MEIVQRILGKVVGEQISNDELELVSGGLIDACAMRDMKTTWSGGEDYVGYSMGCDEQ